MHCRQLLIACLVPLLVFTVVHGASGAEQAATAWERLAPYFSPPSQLAGDFGTYPSPLKFYDGRPVTTAADWQLRRREILERWHDRMGHWPPVIEQPRVEILGTEKRDNFEQHRVRFAWLPSQTTEGYLLVPEGQGRRPAVLTVYYEPETSVGLGKPLRDFGYQLARRGFVVLSIGTKVATEDKTYSLYYPSQEKASLQPLSALAYAAANAYHVLASRPEVDPQRVGVVGHSFGGKWAMFASCLYDKFACGAWSDPGIVFEQTRPSINYWEPWYLGYEPGKWRKRGLVTRENPCYGVYERLLAEGRDLHELHALMAPRPFWVSGGSEDPPERWRALNHAVQVNALLGYKDRVGMSNRPRHDPTPESNELIYLFFEHFLGQRAE